MKKEKALEYIKRYLLDNPQKKSYEYRVTDWTVTDEDFIEVVDTVLDRWLTEGKKAEQFRREIADVMDTRYSVLVNSGSSANLLAVTCANDFWKSKRGNKVITCATAFPTTVAPIIQNGLVPLFIDIDPKTLTYDINQICGLLEREDVVGVILAHNLGFAHQADILREECYELDKWYIEDSCDSLGTTLGGKPVGSFGDFSTLSFFPAHFITTGEGGSVQTSNSKLFRLLQQYSNWGRDCWCPPGQENTCNKRFSQNFGTGLPYGYDHKYIFTKVGYNLKMTEMQAAFGLSQIKKLSTFIEKRRENYQKLYDITSRYSLYLDIIELPEECSPFGFPIMAKDSWIKKGLVEYLEKSDIRTRPVFSGNILKHPMMLDVEYEQFGELKNSDEVMEKMFWVGVHPSVTDEHINMYKKALEGYF